VILPSEQVELVAPRIGHHHVVRPPQVSVRTQDRGAGMSSEHRVSSAAALLPG